MRDERSILHRVGDVHRRIVNQVARTGWLPPLLARLAVGLVFVSTGWGKLQHLDGVTGFFTELGIPAPGFHAALVATTELVCGALVLAGLATRYAAAPLIVVMVVALATAKRDELTGVVDLMATIELHYAVLCLWLSIAGGGLVSLDGLALRLWGSRSPHGGRDDDEKRSVDRGGGGGAVQRGRAGGV